MKSITRHTGGYTLSTFLIFSRRHINAQSRFQFHSIVVVPDRDLPEPAFDQLLVKFGQFIALLSDKILQFLDTFHLDGLGGFIGIRLLLQFSQMENLLGNIIIGLSVVGAVQQFLLEYQQPFRNAVLLGRMVQVFWSSASPMYFSLVRIFLMVLVYSAFDSLYYSTDSFTMQCVFSPI